MRAGVPRNLTSRNQEVRCTYVRHYETLGYMVQRSRRASALKIGKITYFSVADIHRELDVARQTLWRWRKARKIPQGRRYRDRQVVFTGQEVEAIRKYANRLEPVEPTGAHPMKNLRSNSPGRSA